MPYQDTLNEKRTLATQQKSQQAILDGLEAIKRAVQTNPTPEAVVLTDKADISEHTEAIIEAINGLKRSDMGKDQLDALSSVETAVKQLQRGQLDALDQLKKAVEAIEVRPVIKVDAPNITVQERKLDLKPLNDTFQEYLSRNDAKIDLDCYRAQDLKDSGDTQYVGFVNPDGNWYIIENDVKKNTMRYLFGQSDYAQHFKKAATYRYKLLNEAINET